MKKIGFIGVGIMGKSMVRNLMKAGFEVSIYARTKAKVEDVLKDLRTVLGNIPLLMTFRTSKEGGEKAIEAEPYKELNIAAAKTGYVDLVDSLLVVRHDVKITTPDTAPHLSLRVGIQLLEADAHELRIGKRPFALREA